LSQNRSVMYLVSALCERPQLSRFTTKGLSFCRCASGRLV
jgi:hypothetical protein